MRRWNFAFLLLWMVAGKKSNEKETDCAQFFRYLCKKDATLVRAAHFYGTSICKISFFYFYPITVKNRVTNTLRVNMSTKMCINISLYFLKTISD